MEPGKKIKSDRGVPFFTFFLYYSGVLSKKVVWFFFMHEKKRFHIVLVYSRAVNMQKNTSLHSEDLRASCSPLPVEHESLLAKQFVHMENIRIPNGGSWQNILP